MKKANADHELKRRFPDVMLDLHVFGSTSVAYFKIRTLKCWQFFTGWWFQTFYIFPSYIWDNPSH